MPLRTSRAGRHGRPPFLLGARCSPAGMKRLIASHCCSVRSILTVDHKTDVAVDRFGKSDRTPASYTNEVMRCTLAALAVSDATDASR